MLKAVLLFLTNLALAAMATAQNLVPNPGFEDTVNCESLTPCTLLKAAHWRNPNTATPDVFDCDLDRSCGYAMDPNDINQPPGYYHAAFEGLRFAGGYYWYGLGSSNTRDYFMTLLAEPLQAQSSYSVRLRYLLPECYQFAIDHIGAWFGQDSVWEDTPNWLSVTPQARLRASSGSPWLSASEWMEVADTIIAGGGEQWVVIGNFDVADSVLGTTVNPDGLQSYAFYFIDEVRVERLEDPIGFDEVGLAARWSSNGVLVQWLQSFGPGTIQLFDHLGRSLRSVVIPSASTGNSTSLAGELSAGLYIVVADDGRKRSVARFVR